MKDKKYIEVLKNRILTEKQRIIKFFKDFFSLSKDFNYYIFNSCDASIFYVLNAFKKRYSTFEIPENASWLGYEPFLDLLNLEKKLIETKNYGLNVDDYKDQNNLILTPLMLGYLKYIDIEKIKEKDFLIDASGFSGKIDLSNAKAVAVSFEHWKPIDFGFFSFLAIRKEFDFAKEEKIQKRYLKKILSFDRPALDSKKNDYDAKRLEYILYAFEKINLELKSLEHKLAKYRIFFEKEIEKLNQYLSKYNLEVTYFNESLNALISLEDIHKENVDEDSLIANMKKDFSNLIFKKNLDIRFEGISIEIKRNMDEF